MDSPGVESYSMCRALELLHEELTAEVEHYSMLERRNRWRTVLRMFSHKSVRAMYHWTSCLLACVLVVLLLVAFGFSSDREASGNGWLVVEACLILLTVGVNIYISTVSGCQDSGEFLRLTRSLLDKIASCMKYNTWNAADFPELPSPQSPCVSLQWTIRDSRIYNIPTSLLVQGDIVLLRPGQVVPARCKELQDEVTDSSPATILDDGDVYTPVMKSSDETVRTPQTRPSLKAQKFMLLETPYITSLRKTIEDTRRPASIIEHEKYFVLVNWIEWKIIPVVLVLMIVSNILRYMYLRGHVGQWTEMFITLQVQAILPLVPLMFPLMWMMLNYYGQARVFTAFEAAKGSKSLSDDSFDTNSSISVDEARVDLPWRKVYRWFTDIVLSKADVVTRKVNVTHVLGSITSLCCVDKKGILSYPNPSPEKIFFLRAADKLPAQSKPGSEEGKKTGAEKNKEESSSKQKYQAPGLGHLCVVEVLDLTQNPKKSFGLHFDDPAWQKHLSSLKPLGLNILANTCNLETVDWYTQFTDHVQCAALENDETVAVVNRRCLCPLAKEMGFSEHAMDIFRLEKVLGVYRQVSAEATTKERLQRAKSFIQHKIPMPNMVSALIREKVSGSCQLLSQGTADILLSCCTDYWNGTDLCPLSSNDRKKVLDFYQRTSMGSYCTAFSYRPFTQNIATSFSDMYIELPDDCSHFLDQQMRDTSGDPGLELSAETGSVLDRQRSFSVDSLLDSSNVMSIEDSSSCFQAQCNQIFIGMVTMQYQARQDFVQLIDKLESACIRFVHFSQENEVRSRVFSEKMGLEAGWNCHISLLSDHKHRLRSSQMNSGPESFSQGDLSHRTSKYSSRRSTESYPKGNNPVSHKMVKASTEVMTCRSHSAPSIVNLDPAQVKFEMKVKTAIVSPRKVPNEPLSYDDADEYSPLNPDDVNEESLVMQEMRFEQEDLNLDSDDGESRHTSSYFTENTEDSLTGALDNRAKLPRGIENIRPHLRSVDNVPLLVNLFTDCSPDTTKEMIGIMQEHGEVVVVVGSAVNAQNGPIFLQADCSLALEPLYPQVCLKQQTSSIPWTDSRPTPVQLASAMLSIACPLVFRQEDNISMIHLIAEARTQLMAIRNCFYFILCCCLSVTLVQILASLIQLPPVLAGQHLLWLVLVIIPLLGLTMVGNPVDARVMSLATTKNKDHITGEMLIRFILYYLMRFLPPVLVALFCYALTLHSYCQTHGRLGSGMDCAIYNFTVSEAVKDRTWFVKFSGGLVLAQNIFLFLLVLYFQFISMSFVHWTDHLWQQVPFSNKLWLITTPLMFVGQIFFSLCDISIRNEAVTQVLDLSDLHPAVFGVGLAFPVVIVVVNELVKHREIKFAVRSQKRARLDFGTKLGMNSPF